MMCRMIFAISAALLPLVIKYWIKKRYKHKLQQMQIDNHELDNSYYHCIFWTMENNKCREHMYNNTECDNNCSVTYLQTLLRLLASAKFSISMCMYHLTLRQITDELIKAQMRGVEVRLISDCVTSRMEHSKMKFLKNHGFEVRTPVQNDSFMHHKYCVIDAKDSNLQKMFFGSLNLTLQGCVANFEYVVITNNPHMIQQYNKEFESLWETFDNEKSTETSDHLITKIY